MFAARIACTGAGCDEVIEMLVDDLDELFGVVCSCGYGFELLSVVEVELV
jgi:hypothetical protein